MAGFGVKPLDETTWPDFAGLVERHNGVWGGCWCMSFHPEGVGRTKPRRRTGRRRNAGSATAMPMPPWSMTTRPASAGASSGRRTSCRGSSTSVPYREGLTALPDWRITCFFVDKAYRGHGVAAAALAGALQEIARLGGGTVESYPRTRTAATVSSSFLHNGTVSMFERAGFARSRRIGKDRWVVTQGPVTASGQTRRRGPTSSAPIRRPAAVSWARLTARARST